MKLGPKQRRFLVSAGSILAALFAAGAWLANRREPSIIDAAAAIAPIDRTEVTEGSPKQATYWLDDDRLLVVTTDEAAEPMGKDGEGDWQGHADLFTVSSHKSAPLAGLTDLLNRPRANPWGAPSDFVLSPTGNRIHWKNCRYGHLLAYVSASAKLDGSEYRESPFATSWDNVYFWVDGGHVAESDDEYTAGRDWIVLAVAGPRADRRYTAKSELAKSLTHQYLQSLPRNPILACHPTDATHCVIQTGRYTGSDRLTGITSHTVSLLRGLQSVGADRWPAAGMEPSPSQSLILYHMRRTSSNGLIDWIEHRIPAFRRKHASSEGLWLSRADGTGLRELGHLPAADANQLHDLTWLPGSTAVSFVYRGTLYRVPIKR